MCARIGRANSLSEMVFVDNMAYAHIMAAERLHVGSPVGGQAYFITDGSRHTYFDYFDLLLQAKGMRAPTRYAPYLVMWMVVFLLELCCRSLFRVLELARKGLRVCGLGEGMLLKSLYRLDPPMNFFVLFYLSNEFTLVSHKARRDFGWKPIVPPDEALRRTLDWVASLPD